jgi:hypothetical protein
MTATGYLSKLIMRARGAEGAVRPRLPARFEALATAAPGTGWANAPSALDAAPRAASATDKAGFIPTRELPSSTYTTRKLARALDVGEARRMRDTRPAPELRPASSQPARSGPSREEAGLAPDPPPTELSGSPAREPVDGAPRRTRRRAQEPAEADRPAQHATPNAVVRPAASPLPLRPERIAIAAKPAAGVARAVSTPTGLNALSPAPAGPAWGPSAGQAGAPTVRVSIGRVDVRADLTLAPPARRPAAAQSKRDSSLSDYLKRRGRP